ncbi:MAG: FHA domain-containing protein [Anaerolineales bacterium]|nr:FHA domain-containing protein [Anaerolineales bacterium]MCZ2120781.1 FHA domain-containing protein [Anaerolineales bacterium]
MSGTLALVLRLLMAIALYSFLGWAVYLLWREINKQGYALANRRVPNIGITIQSAHSPQIERHFSQPEIILGRDPGCDIPLKGDDTISTRHAQISYHHGQWWAQDLASTNGTSLNQLPLTTPTVLTSGDEIRCGNSRLLVNISVDVFVSPTIKLEKDNK